MGVYARLREVWDPYAKVQPEVVRSIWIAGVELLAIKLYEHDGAHAWNQEPIAVKEGYRTRAIGFIVGDEDVGDEDEDDTAPPAAPTDPETKA